MAVPSDATAPGERDAEDPDILQGLVHHAGMLVIKLDMEGRIVWFNSVFAAVSGQGLPPMVGRDWVEAFIPPEEREATREQCRGLFGSAKGDVHTKPLMTRERGLRHIEWFHSDINDDEGQAVGMLCIGRDVTELQSARDALREAEQRNRAVLETAVNAILTINEERIITSVNSSTERMFGYTRKELIGKNVKMLMPEPYASRHDSYVENYKRTGKRKIIGIGREVVACRKDGTLFPIDLSVGEVILAPGKRLFTGIIRDLTDHKQLEEKILRISEEEQHRIGQDIHDDLCQQLAAIGCLAKVAHQRLVKAANAAAPEVEQVVQMISAANQRAREMARGLVPVVLDASGLMAALADMARGTQQIFRISCQLHCDPPVEVRDNQLAIQLYRIAQEAVANAVKHSKADRLDLSLEEDEGWVRLMVRDNGQGIHDHSPGTGTGMGLLTMSRRARMMGGDLSVENHPLGGTVVICSIPIHTQPSPEQPGPR
jgi:two-component system sensor kinase FixL